jgi:hypothetical protein
MVTPRITCWLLGALLLASSNALASEDVPLPWHSATINFGEPQEKNFLRASTNSDDELTEFMVHWRGQDLRVPPSEFKILPDVQLHTLQILRGDYTGGPLAGPYLNIALRFGDDVFEEYPLAWFLFYGGKFQHITFIKRTSKTTWDYTDKYPGQEPVKAGTSAVIREPTNPKPK